MLRKSRGTAEMEPHVLRQLLFPLRLQHPRTPMLKHWAIVGCPSGTDDQQVNVQSSSTAAAQSDALRPRDGLRSVRAAGPAFVST